MLSVCQELESAQTARGGQGSHDVQRTIRIYVIDLIQYTQTPSAHWSQRALLIMFKACPQIRMFRLCVCVILRLLRTGYGLT